MKLFAALLAALALAFLAAPANATPTPLATHYTPDQLHAFCAKVDGIFTAGKQYDCRTICTTDGDACGVFCDAANCVALAPVQFSSHTTPYLVLEDHKTGVLPPGSTDPWVMADKKDPKPKPPPPPKDVLDGKGGGLGGLGGIQGESKDDSHKGDIDVLSWSANTGGGSGGNNNVGGDARTSPPADHSPSTGGSGGTGDNRTNTGSFGMSP